MILINSLAFFVTLGLYMQYMSFYVSFLSFATPKTPILMYDMSMLRNIEKNTIFSKFISF